MLTGIALGMLAIVLGAFGAHGLGKLVPESAVDSFETGVRYQMYHALLLILLGTWKGLPEKQLRNVFVLVVLGTLFFSFSIYFLATNSLTMFDFKRIGFITPLGGSILILAWGILGFYVFRLKTDK